MDTEDGESYDQLLSDIDKDRYTFRRYMTQIYTPVPEPNPSWYQQQWGKQTSMNVVKKSFITSDPIPIWYIAYWENHPHDDEDTVWTLMLPHIPKHEILRIGTEQVRYELFRTMMAHLLMTTDYVVKWYWKAHPLNYRGGDSERTIEVVQQFSRIYDIEN